MVLEQLDMSIEEKMKLELHLTDIHKLTQNGPSVQFSSVTQSCLTFCDPQTAARQSSLSITSSCSLLKFMSIESVMPSNHLIPVIPFSSHLQSFLASGSFQMNQFFTSRGQSIGASASVLPMNI